MVVVGAGLAGLSAAVRLVDAGYQVTVIEATSHGGGRSRSFLHSPTGLELDNGQHLFMGCYRETLAFLRQIGTAAEIDFQRNLTIDLIKPGGRRLNLRCPALPAPYHLATGLVTMRGLGPLSKLVALRAGLLLPGEFERPDDNETCDAWLRRMGQTAQIRETFWEPFVWATLNDDPLVSSAAMLIAVLERAFMGTRDDSRFGVSRVPLSRLYVNQAITYLRQRGASVLMAQPMRHLEVDDRGVNAVVLRSGDRLATRRVITAVPPDRLLSALSDQVRRDPVFTDVAKLTTAPIINLWVLIDRPLFTHTNFIGLLNSPLHWLFDRNQIERLDEPSRVLVNCTVSGARGMVDDRPETLLNLFKAEMHRFFPDKPFDILDAKLIKERKATISHAAGTYQWRPATVSPVPGLYLAGDWVQTGLPATIESACQSGHDAAAAVLRSQPLLTVTS